MKCCLKTENGCLKIQIKHAQVCLITWPKEECREVWLGIALMDVSEFGSRLQK